MIFVSSGIEHPEARSDATMIAPADVPATRWKS